MQSMRRQSADESLLRAHHMLSARVGVPRHAQFGRSKLGTDDALPLIRAFGRRQEPGLSIDEPGIDVDFA
jgi:hypothetical protein